MLFCMYYFTFFPYFLSNIFDSKIDSNIYLPNKKKVTSKKWLEKDSLNIMVEKKIVFSVSSIVSIGYPLGSIFTLILYTQLQLQCSFYVKW